VLYENAMNFDGCQLALIGQVIEPRAYLTEIFTLISLLKDQRLQEVAICQQIKQNDLCDMLLETPEMHTLQFNINKDLSLRNFLKIEKFTSLTKKAAKLFEPTDSTVTVCLLDKIKDHQGVLEKLLDIQYQQIANNKPLNFTQPGGKIQPTIDKKVQTRIMLQFDKLIATYKKEGIQNKFKD